MTWTKSTARVAEVTGTTRKENSSSAMFAFVKVSAVLAGMMGFGDELPSHSSIETPVKRIASESTIPPWAQNEPWSHVFFDTTTDLPATAAEFVDQLLDDAAAIAGTGSDPHAVPAGYDVRDQELGDVHGRTYTSQRVIGINLSKILEELISFEEDCLITESAVRFIASTIIWHEVGHTAEEGVPTPAAQPDGGFGNSWCAHLLLHWQGWAWLAEVLPCDGSDTSYVCSVCKWLRYVRDVYHGNTDASTYRSSCVFGTSNPQLNPDMIIHPALPQLLLPECCL